MLQNTFIITEEYNNIPNVSELNFITKRFSPRLYLHEFSVFMENIINEYINKDFFNANHVIITATSDIQKLSEISEKTQLSYTSVGKNMDVYYSIEKNESIYNMIICILLKDFHLKKQALIYSPVKKTNT